MRRSGSSASISAAGPDLSEEQEVDRLLAVSALRGRTIGADWEVWKRDPTTYSGPVLNGLFYLFLNRLRPTADLVDAAVARLEEAPRVLEQARENLDPKLASPLIVERGIGSARAGGSYVRSMLLDEAETDPQRDALRAAGAIAGDAFDEYVAYLEGLMPQCEGTWVYGEERYSRQLQEREALELRRALTARDGPGGVRPARRRDARSGQASARHRRLAQGPARGQRQRPSADRRGDAPNATRSGPRSRASFLAETGLVTLPAGRDLLGRPVAGVPAGRSSRVASYIGPPAFSDRRRATSSCRSRPTARRRRRSRSGCRTATTSIPTTSVHEAYPGHHWHIVMRKIHRARLRLYSARPTSARAGRCTPSA